jgi:GNAT superfamily N-acetyltransferase
VKIRIQAAQPTDAGAICRLVNRAYRGETSKQGWTTEADLLDGQRTDEPAVAGIIADPDQCILTARLGIAGADEIVGCVHLALREGRGHLGMLTVHPARQARGLGKLLIEEAESWTREQGCRELRMTVITLRPELLAFYERRGFRRTGETVPFPYGDPRFGLPRRPDLEMETLVKEL